MAKLSAAELEEAKLDPSTVFDRPQDVLSADGLSEADKRAILKRWEMDADALLRAGDEGMDEDAASGELVRAVRSALDKLDSK
ncbi:hypothetical protein A7A08_00610 [Methyloligella halotolerans]|uniref:Uncharacterized protein n=1 Tax=Methyloligella halotolerans TaxID=1177755 RepID=A0A1E2S2N3_9HYPH|nr:hypothetical protein [Methyloligella halotolerans]ODA68776.1 hypothetical protein A7A08_00610 [Methyloligella halotolerans]